MEENDAAKTLVLGVSLAQYAGIQAAVALGFPLEQALTNERLNGKKWERCRSAWGARLAREGQGSALSAALRDKLAEATKWLGRRVVPLEEDLTAWMSFLGAYAADPAPSALLVRLGLRDADVQRLVLAWKRRADRDEVLARKAHELASKAPRGVPAIQVFPGRLRPFPWSPGPVEYVQIEPRTETAGRVPKDLADVDMPAPPVAIETPSFLRKDAPPSAPSAIALPDTPSAVASQGTPKLAPDPEIRGTVLDFRLSDAAKVLPFASAREGAIAVIQGEPRPAKPQSGETALVFELPKGLLPFGPPAQSAAAIAPSETATSPAFELPVRRDVPFGAAAISPANALSPSTGSGESAPSAAPKAPLSTGTVLAPGAPQGPALPFLGEGASAALVGEGVEGTDLAALVRAVRARGPEPSARARSPLGDTAPTPRVLGADARTEASAEKPPALTLEQHASLCAELAFSPERAAEVLARYGVTSETKRSLDVLYTGATAQKAAWEAAYRAYHAWLVDARKNKR